MKGESLQSDKATNSLKLDNLELRMQHDGNLVTYKHKEGGGSDVLWSSSSTKNGDERKEPYTLLL